MLDILVPEVVLQGAGIVAVVGQLEAAGMAQHVRMDLERQSSSLPKPFDEVMKPDGGQPLRMQLAPTCPSLVYGPLSGIRSAGIFYICRLPDFSCL